MTTTRLVRVAAASELPTCLAIRHEVFVVGQAVPEDREIDGLDGVCTHLLALVDREPAGTARLRETADGHAKAERVAVLDRFRGLGLGLELMRTLETESARRGHREVVLSAQVAVIGFYERQGYTVEGGVYEDAGIPHQDMRKRF